MSIRVSETAGACPWFGIGEASEVFAFKWPPFREVSEEYTISPELVHIVTTYRDAPENPEGIYMERRLADVDGERIAFHDALFVSEALTLSSAVSRRR